MHSTIEASTEQEQTFAEALRALADQLDANPALADILSNQRFLGYAADRKTFEAAVRTLGGHREKTAGEKFYGVSRWFGPIEVYVYTGREQVCERVQVGTETVKRELTEVVGTETVTQPVYEWRCAESVLGGAA